MITPYAAKFLNKLQPNFELIKNLEGAFPVVGSTEHPISGNMLTKNKLFASIMNTSPGAVIATNTGKQSPAAVNALRNISDDMATVAQRYPGRKLPSITFKFGGKGSYDPALHAVRSSLYPHDLAHQLGKASVHERFPAGVTALRSAGGVVGKNLSWLVPSAIVGGRALSGMIPGKTDDNVLRGLTKYGPEMYLGAMAAAHGPSALGFMREFKMAPSKVIRENLKAKGAAQGAKIAGIYGALALMRHMWKKKNADLEKKSQVDPAAFKWTYETIPKYLAAGLMGLWLARLGRKVNEDKVPLQRTLVNTANNYRGTNSQGFFKAMGLHDAMGDIS